MPSKFFWYELMTPDVEAAKAFYEPVVGWKASNAGNPNESYTIMSAQGRGVAGILETPPHVREAGVPPFWAGYIEVDDADAAAKRIVDGGGSVHRPPADIAEVGRFAVVADPQGALFNIIAPIPMDIPPPVPARTPGHGGWRELYTSDWRAAIDFYSTQFGWTAADAMDMGEMGIYQLFAAGAEPIGGMMNMPKQFPRPFWLYYFWVDDIDGATDRVTASSGRIMHGPTEVPGGDWIVQASDPQGAMFALVGPKRHQ